MAASTALAFLPHSNWAWGANLLHYYPGPFRLGWGAAGLLALALAAWFTGRPAGPSRPGADHLPTRPSPRLFGIGAALLAGVVFHLARARHGLLGDGYQILVDLRQGNPPTPRSPLYNLLESGLDRLQRPGVGVPTLDQAGLLSTLAGALTIGLAAGLLLRRARTGRIRSSAAIAALLFAQPSLQLFCGYVESYPLLASALILFGVTALDWVEGRGRFLWPVAFVLMAGLSHPFGLALLPALFLLGARGPGGRRRLAILSGGVAAVTLLAALFFAWRPEAAADRSPIRYLSPQLLLSMTGHVFRERSGPEKYDLLPVLSAQQGADLLNHLWLTAAPALLLLVALATGAAGRRAFRSPMLPAFLAAAVAFTALRAGLRTLLGPVRDWDLFAGSGVALTLLAAVAVAVALDEPTPEDAPARDDAARNDAGLVAALVITGLFFTVPWIGLQVDSGRGVARHLAVVDGRPALEKSVAATYHAAMGQRFLSIGNGVLAGNAFERAYVEWPSWNYAWRAGLAYLAVGRLERAAAAMTEMTKRRPDDWRGWCELGNARCGMNLFDQAELALRKSIQLNPGAAAPRIHLARTLMMGGREVEAREQLDLARPLLRPLDPIQPDFDLLDSKVRRPFAPPGR